MPAYADRRSISRPRERAYALTAVVFVQLAFGWILLRGFHVDVSRSRDIVQQLISVTLPKPPPPVEPPPKPTPLPQSAPKAAPDKLGGSPGPKPAHAPPSVTPVIAVKPNAAPSGGGTGTGPALGAGAGGGKGGNGFGAGSGGGDLVQIAGDIYPSDYPRRLAKAGIGGTVRMRCTVGVTGRVSNCVVTRPSGVPELDALTPRLVEQRFVYRPATDRYGRPVPDDIEVDWTWD